MGGSESHCPYKNSPPGRYAGGAVVCGRTSDEGISPTRDYQVDGCIDFTKGCGIQ